jgi:hypothetical protein
MEATRLTLLRNKEKKNTIHRLEEEFLQKIITNEPNSSSSSSSQ